MPEQNEQPTDSLPACVIKTMKEVAKRLKYVDSELHRLVVEIDGHDGGVFARFDILSREYGWTPKDIGDLTPDQQLGYLERIRDRNGTVKVQPTEAGTLADDSTPEAPPPLSDAEQRVLDIIESQPTGQAITGAEIIKKLTADGWPIAQSTLTTHFIPTLRRWHNVGVRTSVGYYIKST